ncbi:MAG: hypothetical protein HYT76_03900 [Deltaproteobacteria bacterium]|nr:hypothetical protein [Deltaproteobacteria bacterium]
MGFDVHITRKDDWFDKTNNISLQEWVEYLEKDPEMQLIDQDKKLPAALFKGDGRATWIAHPNSSNSDEPVIFKYLSGNITVFKPDQEILKKMFRIAEALKAKVQGNECEIYGKDGTTDWGGLMSDKKAWWQFWRS